MKKGQAAILLIILVGAVLLIFLAPQFFKGPPPSEPVRFKNDVITLDNFDISNTKPLENSLVTVSFDVTNNGDKEADKVEIDVSGTTRQKGGKFDLSCESFNDVLYDEARQRCMFLTLSSLEFRRVTLNLQVGEEGSFPVKIKVRYPYSGLRIATIPIIDDKTIRTPPVKFSQSQQSVGPFVIDILPPAKGWAISDQPFEIRFKLRYVGTSSIGTPLPSADKLRIEDDNFIAKLDNFEATTPSGKVSETSSYTWKLSKDKNEQTCKYFGETLLHKGNPLPTGILEYEYCSNLEDIQAIKNAVGCSSFVPVTIKGGKYLINEAVEQDVVVNKEYGCNLQAIKDASLFGYKLGKIEVNYFYDFEFEKTQNIIVRKAA